MKRIFLSLAIIIQSAIVSLSANLPNDYLALAIQNFPAEKQKTNVAKKYYQAWVLAVNPQNKSELFDATKKLLQASPKDIASLSTKNGAKRAVKFIKASGIKLDGLKSATAVQLGDKYAVIYQLPKKSRLREGMNFFVFEYQNDKLVYNPSFTDPLLTLLATCDFKNPQNASKIGFKTFNDSDKITCENLAKANLPFICFKNGALVSEEKIAGVDNLAPAKFYRNAQDIFYDWKLDDYTAFMTAPSKDKFNSQFKSMSDAERKQVLGEYFQWKKQYHKVLDAGEHTLILFSRHKPQCEPYDDTAYLQNNGGKFAITKFGAEKSPLDMFFAKYIYPKNQYLKLISKKYSNTK